MSAPMFYSYYGRQSYIDDSARPFGLDALFHYVGSDGSPTQYDGTFRITYSDGAGYTVRHTWHLSDDGSFYRGGAGATVVGRLPVIIGGRGHDFISNESTFPGGMIAFGDFYGFDNFTNIGKADKIFGAGGSDVLYGQGGNDYLSGGPGSDQLFGGPGNDILLGGEGPDSMSGGFGNDHYYVDNLNDQVFETGGIGGSTDHLAMGVDTVFASINLSIATFNFIAIENLTLVGQAVSGTGNSNANVITGNERANALWGGAGNDTMRGMGGVDLIYGQANNDTLDGGAGHDQLHGNENNDVLIGGEGNDLLNGGADRDVLRGGAGKDQLWGGAGKDVFVFDTVAGRAHRDSIRDFAPSQDKIHLENAIFKKLGKVGVLNKNFFKLSTQKKDANDYVQYNKSTGLLSYDPDGSGRAAAIEIAVLTNKPTLKFSDFHVI
ncbi:MAG: hypothetical protein KF723_18225 [Rhizobiaceae bacterium]|nr:hypothetical protein [Rhizobiaceae bacterium]